MNFEPRPYADIVRDLLVTLTGGTVREQVAVPVPVAGAIVLDRLADRPLRRISSIEGQVARGGPEGGLAPFRFTSADFELIASDGGTIFDAVRFRPEGRQPAPGTVLTVSYYPIDIPAPPLTDLNIGSVVRTLMESVGVELALQEQLLDQVYRSAFLDTAEGGSLDKVVALVGVTRLPGGVPTVSLRFTRAAGATGQITIPVGTVVTDESLALRYATLAPLTLEPGEAERRVLAASTNGEPPAPATSLTRPEVLIAGIGAVTNPTAASPAAAPETDEALRRRARKALLVAATGTLAALEYGLRSIEGVKDVTVTEFPNGVAGEVRVDVVYANPGDAAIEALVASRIRALRPAGIRVDFGAAEAVRLSVNVTLTLEQAILPESDFEAMKKAVEDRLAALIDAVPPGGTIRRGPLIAAVLQDPRLVEAEVMLTPEGGTAAESYQLPDGKALDLIRPFGFAPPVILGGVPAGAGAALEVDLYLPVELQAGETVASAEAAIRLAAETYLSRATRDGTPISFDGLAAAIRDDSRYVLDRAAGSMTLESLDRFTQLADGLGQYGETLGKAARIRSLSMPITNGGGG
ncbi:baseplate J/gp47 family protein [Paracoccus ravus]|uniref:baseplate J/gp47 family protein n=1 Tax=Paracoccus ravus TaxID=2447760 RepID=UPI00106E5CFE|nr:baseplate J/gp47 family protein [Paracoccus ravus]